MHNLRVLGNKLSFHRKVWRAWKWGDYWTEQRFQNKEKCTQPRNLAWQSSFQTHPPQLLLPGQSSNATHKKLLFKKLLRRENAGLMPCPSAILATKRGCCKQKFQDNTHTCCSLVSPRRAFKLLQKTFLPMCRHVVTQCGVSDNKPGAYS